MDLEQNDKDKSVYSKSLHGPTIALWEVKKFQVQKDIGANDENFS